MTLGDEFKMAEDWRGDPWGCATIVLFEVAAELWVRDECPPQWGYSLASDPRDIESYWFDVLDEAQTDDLIHFGNVLERYRAKLKLQGKDY